MKPQDKSLTKQQEREIQQSVAETVTEKPFTFDVDVKPKNRLHKLLIKAKLSPSARHFEIKPQRVINVYRIAGRAVKIDLKGINPQPEEVKTISYGVHIMMDLMNRHGEDIFYICACALQNDHREPTRRMIYIVKNEFEISDLFILLNIAVSNYNIQSFLNSIVLIKGWDVLLSPTNEKASPGTNGG